MPASPASKRKARKQAADVARINRQGDKFVRAYTKAIHDATLAAAAKGKQLVIPDAAIKLITDELIVFSVAGYLVTYQQLGKPERLPLAVSFSDKLKSIAYGFDIDLGTLSKQTRDLVAPNVRENLNGIRGRINEKLSELSANKTPTAQAKRILTQHLEQMGVSPRNKGYVETLVRTHGQLAYGAAQSTIFDKDPDLWGYEYVTVGDDRVREEHEELDGLVRKKDDPIWKTIFPPNGWNCRCQVLAIYEPQRQTATPKNAKTLVDPAFRFNPGKELV